jgi:ribosome maturation factor RimP
MITTNHIKNLAEEALTGSDRFIVDVLVKPGNRIYVFIDSDTSVLIEHCVELSRHIE